MHQNCNIAMCNVQCDIVTNLRYPHRQQSHWKYEGAVQPYGEPYVTSHQMHRDLNQTPSKFCLYYTHHLQFSSSHNTLLSSDCGKRLLLLRDHPIGMLDRIKNETQLFSSTILGMQLTDRLCVKAIFWNSSQVLYFKQWKKMLF